MDFLLAALWIMGGWIIGIIASIPLLQITISVFFSLKIIHRLKGNEEYIELKACKSNAWKTIFINAIIFSAVTWAVISFSPTYMKIGFCIYLCFSLLSGLPKSGVNEQNASDYTKIISKHFRPGMEEKAYQAYLTAVFGNEGKL